MRALEFGGPGLLGGDRLLGQAAQDRVGRPAAADAGRSGPGALRRQALAQRLFLLLLLLLVALPDRLDLAIPLGADVTGLALSGLLGERQIEAD